MPFGLTTLDAWMGTGRRSKPSTSRSRLQPPGRRSGNQHLQRRDRQRAARFGLRWATAALKTRITFYCRLRSARGGWPDSPRRPQR